MFNPKVQKKYKIFRKWIFLNIFNMSDFPLPIGINHINFDPTWERQQEFSIGLQSLMQPKFQPVGNRVQEETERKLDAGGWHPRGQGPSIIVIPTFVALEVTFFTFLKAAGAADILLRVVHCAVTSGRLKCPMHTTPPYIPHTHTHTHTDRTPLHTAPWGCGWGWREALQTLSRDLRGRETARLHRWNRGPP